MTWEPDPAAAAHRPGGLARDEPPAGPWRELPVTGLVDLVRASAGAVRGRPLVVAVDGRSAGGKTTLAEALHRAVPASAVVHTDDVAWQHSFFGWASLLADGVLTPARAGRAVSYRPPGWASHDREGAIEVPPGLDMVLVEGVGAGRRELAPLLDAVLWVRSDRAEARRRGIARDVASGENGDREQTVAFWEEWERQEVPFLLDQRPWDRACAVVDGTPPRPPAPGHVVVADPPGRPVRA